MYACQIGADIDWYAGWCSSGLAWYVDWLDDYYHGITVIRISSVSWGFDTIWIRLGLRNLALPLFLVIWKRETERSASTLIWTGISSAQSPLASLMGAHHTARGSGESRKDGLHPFLWPSLPLPIPSPLNPSLLQISSAPIRSSPPASLSGPGEGIMFLPSQPKGQIKMCCTLSLSLSPSNLLRD